VNFFIDNNLGEELALGLRGFGEAVIHLKESYPEDTPDEVWLEDIGNKGYFLITRDKRIRYNPLENRTLRTYKIGAFFLQGKQRSRCDLILQLVRNWPRIKEFALSNRNKRPFAFRVPPNGTKIDRIF